MTDHFRNAAMFTMAAIASLVVSGFGSTATRAPATGTPATGTSAASSPTTPGSAPATTPAPATPGTPSRATGLAAGWHLRGHVAAVERFAVTGAHVS